MSSTPDAAAPEKKKRRKKKQKDPNNPGRIAQFKQVFGMTRKHDPAVVWWMLLAFGAVVLVALLISQFLLGGGVGMTIYVLLLGIPLGLLAAMFIFARRAERAAYAQIEGQPGAVGAVLGSLRRGWFYDQEPVAAEAGGKMRGMRDLNNAAMVFRAVGRPGVVLLHEGPKGSSNRLAQAEKRKAARVVGDSVPVHIYRVGHGEGELALGRMVKTLKKLDKSISKQEAIVVHQRLKALGGVKAPVPPGVDPRKARMDRRALRGR